MNIVLDGDFPRGFDAAFSKLLWPLVVMHTYASNLRVIAYAEYNL